MDACTSPDQRIHNHQKAQIQTDDINLEHGAATYHDRMGSSIRRTDILTLSNLRNDGRKPEEIRRIRTRLGPVAGSQNGVGGSALVEMGLTIVLATIRGPLACTRRSDELADRAILDVSVKAAAFAPAGDRRVVNPNSDRRFIEMSHHIKRAMEAAVLLHLHPKSRIELNICILADDGGKLCAAINASTLAMVDAGIPLKDLVCACSAGYSGVGSDTALVDLNRREESSNAGEASVYLPCAMMPQRGTIVLAQCEARLPDFKTLELVTDAAMDGCRAVFDILQAAIRERAAALISARQGKAWVEDAFTEVNEAGLIQ